MRPFILAVDVDGTIIKNEKDYVPRELLPNVKEVLDWAKEKGCYIIIWTCRDGEMLSPALDFLDKHKIIYDIVNDNYPKVGFQTSRKIFYDLLIDDRCTEINWLEIKKLIGKKIIEKMAEEIETLSKESK